MQLRKSRKGNVRRTLSLVTANLFMATGAYAQSVPAPQPPASTFGNSSGSVLDDTASDLGTTVLDSSILFYQEQGGRVQAIEPVARMKITGYTGDSLSLKATYDSLTGATPNGATPWSAPQTFTVPTTPPGSEEAVTGASGNTQIITIPGTGTQVAQYTIDPNKLPVDSGFKDRRYALDMSYGRQMSSNTRLTFGLDGSFERDYRSYSANLGLAQDFNDHNTTLSVGVNFEYDQSRPHFGTPTPLTEMNGLMKGPNDSKSVLSVVAGITQVMNRRWLLELNYSIGFNKGYQNDPYKIVSVVDPVTGGPLQYLYEGRPRSRTRQSVYMANKIAIGPTVTDISGRYYHDDWGINSITGEVKEYVPILSWFYIEPQFRYYHQTAANFFNYYLLSGQPLPQFASADSRLGRFSAKTIGLKLGFKVSSNGEFYIVGQDYKQTGASTIPGAPGYLATANSILGRSRPSRHGGIHLHVQIGHGSANDDDIRGTCICRTALLYYSNSGGRTDDGRRRIPRPSFQRDGVAMRAACRRSRSVARRETWGHGRSRGEAHRDQIQPLP